MKNKWRSLFFLLVSLNIILLIVGLSLFLYEGKENEYVVEKRSTKLKNVNFDIKTTKADLNDVINHYIQREGLTGDFHYEVLLNDNVELHGSIPVFTQNVSLQLSFTPEALENGDLILRQNSMTIGQLPLPVSYVMKFVNDNYKFPEWVVIDPKKEIIYISLQTMKLKNDLQVAVESFDLKNDDISFRLIVPTN